MERLGNHYKKTGITVNALRIWGMIFLAAGVIGRGLIQNHMLNVASMSTVQMLEAMQSSEMVMNYATMSLALQALETCAAPIFGALLVEGIKHTSDFKQYFLRILGSACVTEITYNLAMGKGILDLSSRNPMFSLVLGMILIFFYMRYSGGFKNLMVKVLVTAAAFVWVKMLNIEFGSPMLVIIAVLWATRNKGLYRNLAGASASIACSLFSPFFLASPMSFLAVHMCNWERSEEENRVVNYLMYPGILLLAFAVGKFLT